MKNKGWKIKVILRVLVKLAEQLEKIKFTHLSRAKNKYINTLSILASMI